MGIEIERKFLVKDGSWKADAVGVFFRQGYLDPSEERNVRVRLVGERAYLTIKGAADGLARLEFEYEIPPQDGTILLQELCHRPLIEKTRYRIEYGGHLWEVDEFHGDNQGLVVAEVELDHPEAQVELPPWVGREVSGDSKYLNACLISRPYRTWSDEERAVSGG